VLVVFSDAGKKSALQYISAKSSSHIKFVVVIVCFFNAEDAEVYAEVRRGFLNYFDTNLDKIIPSTHQLFCVSSACICVHLWFIISTQDLSKMSNFHQHLATKTLRLSALPDPFSA
jgi:hypothetical protein